VDISNALSRICFFGTPFVALLLVVISLFCSASIVGVFLVVLRRRLVDGDAILLAFLRFIPVITS